jgi:hypothetical protein
MTLRWAAFRRNGAEILTVLLVVVLLARMFCTPERPAATGRSIFYRASHPGESSLWQCVKNENGRSLEIQESARFFGMYR